MYLIIEKNQLLPSSQNGFRPTKETAYCISSLIAQIEEAHKQNKPLHAVYIDFAKAFDSVPYWAIAETMQAMKFPSSFVNNIMELFNNIQTQIKTPYGYTRCIKLNSGVRQGDVISPTLFILSLAPLIWEVAQLKLQPLPITTTDHIFTYADDTTLLASNKDDIREIYNLTSQYASDFGIHINAKKSGYAWLNTEPTESLEYNKQTIQQLGDKKCYKYLGIHINFQLDFSFHYKTIQNKYHSVVKAVFSLKKISLSNRVQAHQCSSSSSSDVYNEHNHPTKKHAAKTR
jgi:hypothetical protein